jgi:hypothetical protein
MRTHLILLAALWLSACASITGSKTQPVAVTAVCQGELVRDASCTLSNEAGSWTLQAPGSVVIHKAYGDLAVTCQRDAATGTAIFQSKSNGGVWGNILAGGVIGYAVDASSGAGFDYPTTMTIVMHPPCPQDKTGDSP